jgi:CsoR family transcriptional regulator, copper-sensing transcriptional repressor
MDSKDLIHRLNRIQGQIDAIKRNIQEGDSSCAQNIRLLKAATNALKKFGQAYVETHLDHCLLSEDLDRKTLDKDLKEVVSSAFSM